MKPPHETVPGSAGILAGELPCRFQRHSGKDAGAPRNRAPKLQVVLRSILSIGIALVLTLSLCAATNSEREDDLLILNPPHSDLPPTFWEQYGLWIILAAVVLLALASVAIWLVLRPKPPVVVPIEMQARRELEALRQQNETGKTLSQVSRVLRRYVVAAFELPPDELTTSELCRALIGNGKIGTEVASAVGEFLCRCDELKFAPSTSPTQIGAATRALEIVQLGEARRAQLREMATATAAGQATQRA